LLFLFPGVYRQKDFFCPRVAWNVLLLLVIFLLTAFHWAILIFQLKIFGAIPSWFWQFTDKGFSLKDLLFFVVLALSLASVVYVLKNPGHVKLKLVMLILLGYAVQVSFGFMQGQGFESIRQRFIYSGHKQYALHACDMPPLVGTATNYEALFGGAMYLGTKPPGIMVFYILAQKASNLVNPAADFDSCVLESTAFAAYVFPLLSVLALIPLFALSRSLLGSEAAFLPCILYIFCPNVLLMHLETDQFLFPLLFMVGLYLVNLALARRSIKWALGAGGYFYLAAFFSFSLLPLLPLALLWVGLDYVLNRQQRRLNESLKVLAGLGMGLAILFLFFRFFLNYDVFLRYTNALIYHREIKEFGSGLRQILNALLLNNIEFAVWSGLPLVLLFLSQVIKGVVSLFKSLNKQDQLAQDGTKALLFAFLATYVALNFFGQTKGEVGRLWIFLLPPIALYAAAEAKSLFRDKTTGVILVVILQLVTAMLTFKFQDAFFILMR